jgi:hypothetical protein
MLCDLSKNEIIKLGKEIKNVEKEKKYISNVLKYRISAGKL